MTIQDIYVNKNEHTPYWLPLTDLGLPGTLAAEWKAYVDSLYNAGFSLNTDQDELVWEVNSNYGSMKENLAYLQNLKSLKNQFIGAGILHSGNQSYLVRLRFFAS